MVIKICLNTATALFNYAGRKRHNKDKCMFLLYIYANSVNNSRGSPTTGEEASGLAIEFTLKAS